MDGPDWKRINFVDPLAVNGLNVAVCGQSDLEKSWTVPSLLVISLGLKSFSFLASNEMSVWKK